MFNVNISKQFLQRKIDITRYSKANKCNISNNKLLLTVTLYLNLF